MKRMTAKRQRVLDALGKEWQTCPELQTWLGQTHTEANRLVKDLLEMGKIEQAEDLGDDGKTRRFRAV